MIKKILKFCLFMVLAFNINAYDYYVDVSTGDDSNRGNSWESAFMTIARASQMAMPGDNVYIAPGRYKETLSPIRNGNNEFERIKYIGYGDKVILDGSGIRQCASNRYNFITFDNLEFTNNYISYSALVNSGKNVIIKNCEFYDNKVYNSTYSGGIYNTGVDLEIFYCKFYNNQAVHSGAYQAGALASTVLIKKLMNCLFYNNKKIATYSLGLYCSGAVVADIYECKNNIFMNNTIEFTDATAHTYPFYSAYKMYNSSNADFLKTGFDFNVFYNNVGGESVSEIIGEHSLSVDPLFIDAANNNFYLMETSPLINAGAPNGEIFETIGPNDNLLSTGVSDEWNGWKDEEGKILVESTFFEVNAGFVKLKDCIVSSLVSPVYDLKTKSTIKKLMITAEMWENLKAGNRQVIDVDKTYPREVEYRVSDEETALNNAEWKKIVIGNEFSDSGRFLQIRVTLRKNGE